VLLQLYEPFDWRALSGVSASLSLYVFFLFFVTGMVSSAAQQLQWQFRVL
jgi:hypothetical protein